MSASDVEDSEDDALNELLMQQHKAYCAFQSHNKHFIKMKELDLQLIRSRCKNSKNSSSSRLQRRNERSLQQDQSSLNQHGFVQSNETLRPGDIIKIQDQIMWQE